MMKRVSTFLIGGILVFTACQTAKKLQPVVTKKPARTLAPVDFKATEIYALTKAGENTWPSVDLSETKMLFVSRNRPSHLHPEIYEMDLKTGTEKRITYQSAQVACPVFVDEKSFLYVSTTDEEKEGDEIVQTTLSRLKKKAEFPQDLSPQYPQILKSDLYLSNMDASKIERLTKNRGFEGELSVIQKAKRFFFTGSPKGHPELLQLEFPSRRITGVLKPNVPVLGSSATPDLKKIAWIRFDPNSPTSVLEFSTDSGKTIETLPGPAAYYWQPQFHPSGDFLLFASNRDEVESFELYIFDFKNQCTKRLLYDADNDLYPRFNSDGSEIYFASNRLGSYQVFKMKFSPPDTCLVEPKAIPSASPNPTPTPVATPAELRPKELPEATP